MNICKNCEKEFEAKRADAKFCSGNCRQQFGRRSVTDNVTVSDSVTDKPIKRDKDDLSVTNVTDNDPLKRITNPKYVTVCGDTHFFYRGERYEGSYFKSKIYEDLMEELVMKPIEQLEAEGYSIPAWKYVKVGDAEKYACGCKRGTTMMCPKHGRM